MDQELIASLTNTKNLFWPAFPKSFIDIIFFFGALSYN